MLKIMFVCHGNICRSPMAEFLFKEKLKKNNINNIYVSSGATSSEETGNEVYYKTKQILEQLNIDCSKKRAYTLNKTDYNKYDLFIAMDYANIKSMLTIFGEDKNNKIHLLLSYAGVNQDILDPWYTRNFDKAYKDILFGIDKLYCYLINNNMI